MKNKRTEEEDNLKKFQDDFNDYCSLQCWYQLDDQRRRRLSVLHRQKPEPPPAPDYWALMSDQEKERIRQELKTPIMN